MTTTDPTIDADGSPATTDPDVTFDAWAVVHLMGRRTIAGRVRETKLAGKDLLCIDVPATDNRQARTLFVSPDALYDLELVDEETARLAAKLDPPAPPVNLYSARAALQQGRSPLALGLPDPDDDDDDGQDDDDEVPR